jgi:hypothetical protein
MGCWVAQNLLLYVSLRHLAVTCECNFENGHGLLQFDDVPLLTGGCVREMVVLERGAKHTGSFSHGRKVVSQVALSFQGPAWYGLSAWGAGVHRHGLQSVLCRADRVRFET